MQHNIKDEHIAVIVKWIIEISSHSHYPTKFSIEFYEWIFTFLHDQQFSRLHKAILIALNSIFMGYYRPKGHILIKKDKIIHLEKVLYSWNTYPDDVLAVCLLIYGNFILKLQDFKRNRNISDEIQNVLMTIFKTSSSELISIRAAFCLIFVHRSNIWLQLTLYKNLNFYHIQDVEIIVKLIDIFIVDLYNYLCNKENIDYLADPMPNYVDIALKVCGRNIDVFRNALKNSSIGEEKLRREHSLYFYHINNPQDRQILVELYTVCHGITYDLIDMLKWSEFVGDANGWKYLEHIKQVSDRDIIENIFQCLDSISYDNNSAIFLSIFKLLVQFVQTDRISLLEVHQHILPIIKNFSLQDNDETWKNEKEIFNLLLNLSCIRKISPPESKKKLFTESEIDENFRNIIYDLIINSALYLRRNYFFINFRSIMNNST